MRGRRSATPLAAVRLAVLLAVLALSSCGAIRALTTTRRALRNAGYDVSAVNYTSDNGLAVVDVRWRPKAESSDALSDETHGIAAIVWTVTPFRFDELQFSAIRVSVPGLSSTEIDRVSRAQLEAEFGPRPAGLDDKSFVDRVNVRAIAIAVAVALLLGVGLIVLIVVLVVRGRRKPPPPWPPGWPPQALVP